MHTFVVTYSFHGPNHEDGRSTVKAYDSAEAAQIVRNKFRSREVWIINVRRMD